jgi:hypothetical protein
MSILRAGGSGRRALFFAKKGLAIPSEKAMPLKDLIQTVLTRYPAARSEVFTDHGVADLIRRSIPHAISTEIPAQRYRVYGSAGQGNWAVVPWVAVFDKLITETAAKFSS